MVKDNTSWWWWEPIPNGCFAVRWRAKRHHRHPSASRTQCTMRHNLYQSTRRPKGDSFRSRGPIAGLCEETGMGVQPHQGSGDSERAAVSIDSGHYGMSSLHRHCVQAGLNPKAGPRWGTWEWPNTPVVQRPTSFSRSSILAVSHSTTADTRTQSLFHVERYLDYSAGPAYPEGFQDTHLTPAAP